MSGWDLRTVRTGNLPSLIVYKLLESQPLCKIFEEGAELGFTMLESFFNNFTIRDIANRPDQLHWVVIVVKFKLPQAMQPAPASGILSIHAGSRFHPTIAHPQQ